MEMRLDQNLMAQTLLNRTDKAFGKKIGIVGKIFGCWHKKLSRPFSDKKSSYLACLECGARKPFDAESLKTMRGFYYPPVISMDKS